MRTFEEYWEDQVDYARSEGLAEGKAEGLAEGKAEGLAEGKAEGLAEGKEAARAEHITALMENMGWTEQEARKALGYAAASNV